MPVAIGALADIAPGGRCVGPVARNDNGSTVSLRGDGEAAANQRIQAVKAV